ncbi:MAG TPA: restriction endonuclease subunit S, partial [Xylella fastidiosa subsp. multiplex]
ANFSLGEHAAIEIPLPSQVEQHAIAKILGTLDDKIELNRRTNETLEAMARALFKAWCVDFEPVRAKLEGRWQRGESLPDCPACPRICMTSFLPGSLNRSWGRFRRGGIIRRLVKKSRFAVDLHPVPSNLNFGKGDATVGPHPKTCLA